VLDYVISRTVADNPLLYLGLPGIIAIIIGIVAGLRVVQVFVLKPKPMTRLDGRINTPEIRKSRLCSSGYVTRMTVGTVPA